jgi:hypothetical protein
MRPGKKMNVRLDKSAGAYVLTVSARTEAGSKVVVTQIFEENPSFPKTLESYMNETLPNALADLGVKFALSKNEDGTVTYAEGTKK